MSEENRHAEDSDFIDVRQLMAERSLDELNQLAEQYFAGLTTKDYHLAKPFGSIDETPQLLINFAVILQGVALCPGLTVLEFGAGTCWAARFLTQLGVEVIALDVSPSALSIGRELYERHPVFGNKPAARFLNFNGSEIDLPNGSVDRIICLDAFHHVPNPDQVLREMSRVLKIGGIAGFAEPGPNHSQSPQSQYEMRTFRVIENDVNIDEIWRSAQRAGFTDMKLAVFNVPPVHMSPNDFHAFLEGLDAPANYLQVTRDFLQNQRNFFLYKGQTTNSDSRFRSGLKAEIRIAEETLVAKAEAAIVTRAFVKNISPSIWLPRSAGLGAVMLGVHVYDTAGKLFRHSFHWEALTPAEGRPILPSETVEVEVSIPSLPEGNYILEFDMVSNDVCWFSLNGSQVVRVPLEVFATDKHE